MEERNMIQEDLEKIYMLHMQRAALLANLAFTEDALNQAKGRVKIRYNLLLDRPNEANASIFERYMLLKDRENSQSR